MGDDRDSSQGGGCFGCSSGNARGLALSFRRVGDQVEANATLDPTFAGYGGVIHGGIVATLLDEAMGWAILTLLGRYAVTQSLNVDYRRPVMVGRPLTVRAGLRGEPEGSNVRVDARVLDARQRLLASAAGTWVLVRENRGANVRGVLA